MIYWVLGFAFTPDGKIILIRKNRPESQSTFLNGFMNVIEFGERAADAMIREFKDGTGVTTLEEQWFNFCTIRNSDRKIYCYVAKNITGAKTITNEPVEIKSIGVTVIRSDVSKHLAWLIPMAWQGEVKEAEVTDN